MSFYINKSNLTRSKSLGALDLSKDSDSVYSHIQSDSSLEVCDIFATRPSVSFDDHLDSGFIHLETSETNRDNDSLTALELKVAKLISLLHDQQHLLQDLKDEIFFLKSNAVKNDTQKEKETEEHLAESFKAANERGKILLDALELKQAQCSRTDLKDILIEYLKTDDLKNHLAVTVVERVKEVIRQCLSETFNQVYLPFLERSQRRLLKHVSRTLHNAIHELEKNSNNLYKSVHKSRRFQFAIDRNLVSLESDRTKTAFKNLEKNLENILKTELTEWSKSLLMPQFLLVSHYEKSYVEDENPVVTPIRSSQSAIPEQSTIDQLMTSALINRQIQKGEINEAFEEALSSSDLSLVMTACRAVEQHRVFNPCTLKQPVLLALIQQLATDMLHDTQLKCSYLEDALINLDVSDKVTRTYLPLIVNEIRKHLSKFLHSYPSHVAGRRIMLIVMVADSLLNL